MCLGSADRVGQTECCHNRRGDESEGRTAGCEVKLRAPPTGWDGFHVAGGHSTFGSKNEDFCVRDHCQVIRGVDRVAGELMACESSGADQGVAAAGSWGGGRGRVE